ncbi:MAG: OmpA family protein [Alphaproteobacteria bacterium]|nr:OmpA family protein [Alphaproteobacteria bacterium]
MYKAIKKIITMAICASFCAVSVSTLSGCTTDPYTGEQKVKKTAFGAGLGALVGGTVGYLSNDKGKVARKNALIGAGVGALAGGGIGAYMDKQEQELRQKLQSTGVSVTRVENDIILNMPSNITFGSDKYEIRSQFFEVLDSVVLVLKEYDQTNVEAIGHTDSTGSNQYNQVLSENRAKSVANFLIGRDLIAARFVVGGLGETRPITSNATREGRALNRRVELRLYPSTVSGR